MSDSNKGDGNNVGNGNGDEAGGQQKKAREGCNGNGDGNVWVAGNKVGKHRKAMAMAMATRMAGKWSAMAMKRLMVMATRVAGGRQAMATATKRAMVTVTRAMGNKKAMAMAADGDEGGG
jgi:hypothetical protein